MDAVATLWARSRSQESAAALTAVSAATSSDDSQESTASSPGCSIASGGSAMSSPASIEKRVGSKRQKRQRPIVSFTPGAHTLLESRDCVLEGCHNPKKLQCQDPDDPATTVALTDDFDCWNMCDIPRLEKPDHVVIAVEATAMCSLDLDMELMLSDENEDGKICVPYVLGSNIVGRAEKCGPEAMKRGIEPGTRVASIVKYGSHAKHATVSSKTLMPVPDYLDAGDVACLISAYLPAFQALHHGRQRPYRYSRSCLAERNILITKGESVEAQAAVKLARLAGATNIFVLASREHWDVLDDRQITVYADEDPEGWLPDLEADMDLIVDFNFPKHFDQIRETMAHRGRVVCFSRPRPSQGILASARYAYEYFQLSTTLRATLFDFMQNVEQYHEEMEEDFRFLLKLLSLRQIRPRIDRYINLADVPQVHEAMRSQPLTGAIICEPWTTQKEP